jgi:hypothetical protein
MLLVTWMLLHISVPRFRREIADLQQSLEYSLG